MFPCASNSLPTSELTTTSYFSSALVHASVGSDKNTVSESSITTGMRAFSNSKAACTLRHDMASRATPSFGSCPYARAKSAS